MTTINGKTPQLVAPGVWVITTPFSHVGTDAHVYVIEDEKLTLIDAGFCAEQTIEAIKDGINALGYELSDIKQIIYTHHHIDHFGGGVLLSRQIDCQHLINHDVAGKVHDIDTLYSLIKYMPDNIIGYYPCLAPAFEDNRYRENFYENYPELGSFDGRVEGLVDEQIINLGKRRLRVILTPGHSPHNISLLDEDNGLLFTGDFLLQAGPGYSFVDGGDIADYLASLDKVEEMNPEVKLLLPGHGEPISDFLTSVRESRGTIHYRNKRLIKYLTANGPKSIVDMFDFMFPGLRSQDDFAAYLSMFLTHLRFLENEGQVVEIQVGEGIYKSAE